MRAASARERFAENMLLPLMFQTWIERRVVFFTRVYAPLGIDIGSQTVPEIAVSIVAELIAINRQLLEDIQVRIKKAELKS